MLPKFVHRQPYNDLNKLLEENKPGHCEHCGSTSFQLEKSPWVIDTMPVRYSYGVACASCGELLVAWFVYVPED